LSIGFRMLSFLPSCYSSYGAWTLTPVGLAPTVHASLRWTHRFWGLILWNSLPGEFISIPKEVIGMASTCEDKSRAVPKFIPSGAW
jgi:hypothetical protein